MRKPKALVFEWYIGILMDLKFAEDSKTSKISQTYGKGGPSERNTRNMAFFLSSIVFHGVCFSVLS